ncbi:MAG: DUF2344 domain-containing protein [Oscillospiraceae bacterium]|nr:DUF2344 domain-containing protein [Oscillospiraceae bacterium]
MNNNITTDVRLFYTKTGDLKYISHLDMNRCMQRVLRRSRLPVWHTEGFNPHVYITFALPLSLGIESVYETMDFRLMDFPDLKAAEEALAAALPAGLKLIKIDTPVMKVADIALADFEVKAYSAEFAERSDELLALWNEYEAQDSIIIAKKTKAGVKDIDVKPHLMQQKQPSCQNGELTLTLRLSAGNTVNINPMLVFGDFCEKSGIKFDSIGYTKLAVYNKNGVLFR